ncbi:DUF6193 family natural product biosynthesis protein [Kitasatospora sp. NPDC059795]|uniref:DUF6193 family natural product biosynthesis protein n=1 Tax=Kitasatospora sp. NPDC059795 TaxID=3346949 RepID=UPI00364C5FB9
MTHTPAEIAAAAAAFGAELDRTAAGLGLTLPTPDRLSPSGAEFLDHGTDSRAWIHAWVSRVRPAVRLRRAGATLANGHAPNLAGAVRAVAAWQAGADLATVRGLAPFLIVHDWAFAHEREPLDAVELAWRHRFGHFDTRLIGRYPPNFRTMFEAAFAEPRLRRLAPVTSHYMLWFSATPPPDHRKIGGSIEPRHDGSFLVRSRRGGDTVEVATVEEAVALVLEGLPPGY